MQHVEDEDEEEEEEDEERQPLMHRRRRRRQRCRWCRRKHEGWRHRNRSPPLSRPERVPPPRHQSEADAPLGQPPPWRRRQREGQARLQA